MSSSKIYSGLQTSLMVQWLRLHAPNAGGIGLIPGQGTKTPHAIWSGKSKKKKKKKPTRLVSHVCVPYHGEDTSLPLFSEMS